MHLGAHASLSTMGFTIFQAAELPFVPRDETDPRSVARLSDALAESRANVWRYPPGAQGKRHRDLGQEEVFVVLDGTLTVDLGEPPERHEVPRGGIVVVERGTILQLRNAGVAMVLYPLSAFRAMNAAAVATYQTIRADRTQRGVLDRMQTREELYEILNYHAAEQQLDRTQNP